MVPQGHLAAEGTGEGGETGFRAAGGGDYALIGMGGRGFCRLGVIAAAAVALHQAGLGAGALFHGIPFAEVMAQGLGMVPQGHFAAEGTGEGGETGLGTGGGGDDTFVCVFTGRGLSRLGVAAAAAVALHGAGFSAGAFFHLVPVAESVAQCIHIVVRVAFGAVCTGVGGEAPGSTGGGGDLRCVNMLRGLGEAVIQQGDDVGIAVGAVGAQDHGHDPGAVALGAGDQVGTAAGGGAGFAADIALVGADHPVDIGEAVSLAALAVGLDLVGLGQGDGAEDVVLHDLAHQQGHVVDRGVVVRVADAGGVAVMGVGHAQLRGPFVHFLDEGGVAAGDGPGQQLGRIIAGGEQQAVQGVAHRQGFAHHQTHVAAAHQVAADGSRGAVIQVQILKGQKAGHQLGGAGHGVLPVDVLAVVDLAGVHIHDDSTLARQTQGIAGEGAAASVSVEAVAHQVVHAVFIVGLPETGDHVPDQDAAAVVLVGVDAAVVGVAGVDLAVDVLGEQIDVVGGGQDFCRLLQHQLAIDVAQAVLQVQDEGDDVSHRQAHGIAHGAQEADGIAAALEVVDLDTVAGGAAGAAAHEGVVAVGQAGAVEDEFVLSAGGKAGVDVGSAGAVQKFHLHIAVGQGGALRGGRDHLLGQEHLAAGAAVGTLRQAGGSLAGGHGCIHHGGVQLAVGAAPGGNVIFFGGIAGGGGDDHVAGDGIDADAAVGIAGIGHIPATHGDGDIQGVKIGSQGQHGRIGAACQDCGGTLQHHIGKIRGNIINGLSCHGGNQGIGNPVHALGIGVHPAVGQVFGVHAAAFQIHGGAAEISDDLLQLGIEGGGLSKNLGRQSHAVDFRVFVALGHPVEHDGIGLAAGGRLGVGKGTVAVITDQGCVIDIGGAQGVGVIHEIIGAQEDHDVIRVFGAAVELGTAVSGIRQAESAGRMVDQQFHAQGIDGLLPPGIPAAHIGLSGPVVCRITGNTLKGGNTVAQNGDGLSLKIMAHCGIGRERHGRQQSDQQDQCQNQRKRSFHNHPSFRGSKVRSQRDTPENAWHFMGIPMLLQKYGTTDIGKTQWNFQIQGPWKFDFSA